MAAADTADPAKVTRLIFCSGQVYYQLAKARKQNSLSNVAIVRVEQISPFPYDLAAEQVARYPNAEIIWAQEEPLNAGAWTYVSPRLRSMLKQWGLRQGEQCEVKYAGRQPAASTATGTFVRPGREAGLDARVVALMRLCPRRVAAAGGGGGPARRLQEAAHRGGEASDQAGALWQLSNHSAVVLKDLCCFSIIHTPRARGCPMLPSRSGLVEHGPRGARVTVLRRRLAARPHPMTS